MSLNLNEFKKYIEKSVDIVSKGAFLTTKNGDKINTMTIGWASFGIEWGLPVAEVMVRESRYTKLLLDNSLEFTLTFPLDDSMKESLAFCGKKSGRDTDKVSECNLSLCDSKLIGTPSISCKAIVMECKVLSRMDMDKSLTDTEIIDKWYPSGDMHTNYHAKILSCYEIK
jgi:flavin reductase (DIM6/NTAB) family NADH-FMN oxidoreductase RutF